MSHPNDHDRDSPSLDASSNGTHERRASTHSIPVSYAYGAPSVGKPRSPIRGSPHVRGHHRDSSRMTDDGASVMSGSTAFGEESEGGTGRAKEPAAVRYARIAQRKRDLGQPFPPPQPPAAAPAGPASGLLPPPALPVSAARSKLSAAASKDTSVNIATAFAQAVAGREGAVEREVEEEPREDDASGKETHVGGNQGEGGSKKRKKRASKDPTFKHRAGETESDQELSEDQARGKAKRSKVAREEMEDEQGEQQEPAEATKKPSHRRKSGDPTYRPGKTSEPDSEEESDEATTRRRRSKGKGRAAPASNAIPIGRRDGEVWFGKKRKGRKGRKSGGTVGSDDEEEQSQDGEGSQEPSGEQELGGYEYDPPQDFPPTSFFLRPKSPSPSAPTHQGRDVGSSPGGHSPFQANRVFNVPSFAALDKSLNSSFGGRDSSLDDSGVRGSSYDYSEEERIVASLEKQASGSGMRRRNRLPGPPIAEPFLDGIEEEEEEEEQRQGGGAGRMLGKIVRPLWSAGSRVWRAAQNPLLDWYKIWRAVAIAAGVLFLLFALRSPPSTPNTVHHHRYVDYIPFFSSKPTYVAPDLPPDSFAILVQRLSVLENAMGELSSISPTERARSDRDHSLLGKISGQVLNLEGNIEAERKRAIKALEHVEADSSKAARELEKVIKVVKADLDLLVSRVKSISDEQSADERDIQRLQSGIDAVGKDIVSLGTKVAQVAKDAQAGANAERISKIALEAIEARLPSKLAMRMDPSGKLEIDPAFWKHLRDAFAEKKDVADLVEAKVSSELAKRPVAGSSSKAPAAVVKQPSWKDFLVANEAALRSWVDSDISSRLGADAIVSKRTFLDILHREIKHLKVEFETKSNENVQKIGEELLSKVAKQEQMKKDSRNPFARPSTPSGSPQQITIKASDGSDISALIGSLVDTALLRYSKDVLARPDYALYTSGGRVIPSLTSPTYEARPVGIAPKLLAWAIGANASPGRPPVTALHPDNSLGSCWPFAGSQGQLGILLSRRTIPSDITIEHASVDIALDGDVSSAPKDFEVWGVVEGRGDIAKLQEYREEQLELKRPALDASRDDFEDEPTTSLPPTPNHMLLAAGSYDITSSSPVQTFPVTASARQLGIPVSVVVVKVLSNHGDPHYTCLYRVRLSGASELLAAQAAAAASTSA